MKVCCIVANKIIIKSILRYWVDDWECDINLKLMVSSRNFKFWFDSVHKRYEKVHDMKNSGGPKTFFSTHKNTPIATFFIEYLPIWVLNLNQTKIVIYVLVCEFFLHIIIPKIDVLCSKISAG